MNTNQINGVPSFADMHAYLAVQRSIVAYQLSQKIGRLPTEREIDIAELQAAWNTANPFTVQKLAVDGVDGLLTENTLRTWLEKLRLEEFIRTSMAASVIYQTTIKTPAFPNSYPNEWTIISSTTQKP